MGQNEPAGLSAKLYDKHYYDKSLPGLEYLERDVIDLAAEDTVYFGAIKEGLKILDVGCGRGTLAIELAKRGAFATGVDFSEHAVNFAKNLLSRFPKNIQNRVQFRQLTISELNFHREFDVIVFNQVYEHLHDHELIHFLRKFKEALKPTGRLVISTPNLDYVRYLYPIKRIVDFPLKLIKEPLRVLRGRSKHTSSATAFFKEMFKIRYPESEHTRLHINLQTPASIKKFLEQNGFSVRVECVDRHKNLISRLMRRVWGETIWAVCTLS